MRTFHCSCGNSLFFGNILCLKCNRAAGWCPSCRQLSDVISAEGDTAKCSSCGAQLARCANFKFNVCNRFVLKTEHRPLASGESHAVAQDLCDCCRFNKTIPDLKVTGNQAKWARLEDAKRRVLYDLSMLGLPFGNERDGISPPLAFEFKGDASRSLIYRSLGSDEKGVYRARSGRDHHQHSGSR